MSLKERRKRDKEALRLKMLDAAAELLVKGGYKSLSIRKIAAKIEYSPALIYHYFSDKADLVNNLIDESFDKFLKKIEKLSQDVKDDPVKMLEATLRALIELGVEFPNHYRAVFMNYLGEKHAGQYFAESPKREEGFILLVKNIEEGIDKKLFKEVHAITTAQVIWSSVHGLILTLITEDDMPEIKQNRMVDQLVDIIFNGLKA